MPGPAILVKLAASAEQGLTASARLGATGPSATLRPLFSLGAPGGGALAPTQPQTWFRAEPAEADALGPSPAAAWDAAHAALADLGVGTTLLAAEPDLRQGWVSAPPSIGPALAAAGAGQPEPQKGPPFDLGDGFGWHLDDDHSGLRAAREKVGADGGKIVIAHLDTGYDPKHLGLPANLDTARQRNFVDPDRPNDATDNTPASGTLTNRGHGTGTLGILAGGSTAGLRSDPAIPADFGELGGTPHAQIVPVRVANSVVEFWTSTIAQGIDYARQLGVDVLSMSMGGLPASTWADAVNLAYEAGIVLVTAAGNSIGGLPTTLVVYPARFNRVIAACGVMAKGNPYYGLDGRVMEGCAGPPSKMSTAIAAYTPNVPWLRLGDPDIVNMSGAGTSAATPQVAAAAALWLAAHGDAYPRSWQRVEAVRAALFGSAAPPANQYFGRGLLRARAALDRIPDRASLQQTPPDSGAFAFLHLITSLLGAAPPDPRQLAMFRLELTQLALTSPAAAAAVADPGTSDTLDEGAQRRLLEAILDASSPSLALRAFLERLLARPATVQVPPPPRREPPPPPPDRGQGMVRRKHAVPKPAKRRLRVFATDPGDSTRLGTSFINVAAVEVPWEDLEPGPVGEYLEVVDVDPASDAFYPPIALEHRYLLGQDGIAPSEGNPQFHQQMVYAVASRTIRNFEIALGRRALWAERLVQTKDGPGGVYVRRLRIYPHALRERNAYYSPDRKALLFGYYSDDNGPSHGRRIIFTCLSHDVVAHETTHALLDGLHRRFQEPTNPDVLAFHEAFADIVAIFQHFTFPELLRYELRRLRGNLRQASVLSDLARQFGQSLHNARALREAITPGDALDDDGETAPTRLCSYMDTEEPHMRGAILVAAVFEAFTAIYSRRTEDLVRLATAGSGVLAAGAIPPDLVERLAQEAVDTAQRVLTAAIRALDYMPPVDPTFGDYLRAVVTADADLAPDRGMGYRVAFAEAFARRGIYPADIPNVSPDGLLWQAPEDASKWRHLGPFLRALDLNAYNQVDRERAFDSAKSNAKRLHAWLVEHLDAEMARTLGLDLGITKPDGTPLFEVHSVRPALRTTADGEPRTDIVAVITQHRQVPIDKNGPAGGPGFTFRGGCTLLLDRSFEADECPIRYAISRPIFSDSRADSIRRHVYGTGSGLAAMTYTDREAGGAPGSEPFQALHAALPREG